MSNPIISKKVTRFQKIARFWVLIRKCNFWPILGQKSYGETKIFEKFRKFWSRKSGFQEVLDKGKGNPKLEASDPRLIGHQ